jgi:hypothetical protein
VDPYRAPNQSNNVFDPKDHVCETLTIPGSNKEDCNMFGLLWSPALRQFIATVGCDTASKKQDAFFYTTSTDLVQWAPIKVMFNRSSDLPPAVAAMTTSMHYPTLLDPAALSEYGDSNFYTVGDKPYLFWTGTGHSPFQDGRHLWATPMNVLTRVLH